MTALRTSLTADEAQSETEALDQFLRMARSHKAADAHAVRRIEGRE
ncbi:hypothetical protein M4D51_06790 [Microbacterium sp. p3-SID338]|nr:MULTISPECIES: hypothetical protein [unclassified Microbacterium]MCT1395429.1 hypothetical protein [Microbacterium sp. p3-SID338]